MHHVAIMKKSWGLTQKILSGEKKIESRWYTSRVAPWDRIKPGDMVYFKDSGESVSLKAQVHNVLQFSDLTPRKIQEILSQYGKDDGIDSADIPKYFEMFKDKRYCILIFLKNPEVVQPFHINKKGFGAMSAWITVEDIREIQL
jgi:hypothetical protein